MNHEALPQNLQKMTFPDYCKQLPLAPLTPREQLIVDLARLCGKSPATVRFWRSGKTTPCPEDQATIEQYTGIPASELFPKKQ